jgi:electron transport complex protein RnfE
LIAISEHLRRGLWTSNPALVQLLGLCPLLAVSTSAVNGLSLGVTTTLALLGSNLGVSLSRRYIQREVRLPVYVLILATMVTVVDLCLQAYAPDVHRNLGIFVPLIVTNCAVLARAEAFASRHGPADAAADACAMGLGFALVLTSLGALRELLGTGVIFAGAEQLFGAVGRELRLEVFEGEGLLVALLPPGAFLTLAALGMARNLIIQRGEGK